MKLKKQVLTIQSKFKIDLKKIKPWIKWIFKLTIAFGLLFLK